MDMRHTEAAAALRRTGGWLLAIGSLSVVVVSAFYLASPPSAIAPTLSLPPDARTAALDGAATMRVAGSFGVVGNLVMAVGAIMLGIERAGQARANAAAGWLLIAMSLVVFLLVDTLVGFALPAAAASEAAFLPFRLTFSATFIAGTALFGFGAMLSAAELRRDVGLLGWLGWVALIDGAAAAFFGLSGLMGLSAPILVGATIGIGALTYAGIGVLIATRAAR